MRQSSLGARSVCAQAGPHQNSFGVYSVRPNAAVAVTEQVPKPLEGVLSVRQSHLKVHKHENFFGFDF